MAKRGPQSKQSKSKVANNYRHPKSESLMRPDVGTQAQFKKKLPPKKYRYDDLPSPSGEWDGQNPVREQGELLIQEIPAAQNQPYAHILSVLRQHALSSFIILRSYVHDC